MQIENPGYAGWLADEDVRARFVVSSTEAAMTATTQAAAASGISHALARLRLPGRCGTGAMTAAASGSAMMSAAAVRASLSRSAVRASSSWAIIGTP